MIPKNIKQFIEGGKRTRFVKNQKPWNMGKAKRFNCQTCGIVFENKSHGKPKYCSERCKKNGAWGKQIGRWNIGRSSWNKGKSNTWIKPGFTLSKETKMKISVAKKGQPSLRKGKPLLQLRGENNPNWRGGIGTKRHRDMGRTEYKQWRQSVFERDNYMCVLCGRRGIYLQADHKNPWSKYSDMRYDINNGRTLCMDCHYLITFGKEKPRDIQWGKFV